MIIHSSTLGTIDRALPGSPLPLLSRASTVASPPPLTGATDHTSALEKAVTRLNHDFASIGIEFDIHDDSGRIVTRITDRESGDLLRQIPTEDVLHMARLAVHQRGRLLQTTA